MHLFFYLSYMLDYIFAYCYLNYFVLITRFLANIRVDGGFIDFNFRGLFFTGLVFLIPLSIPFSLTSNSTFFLDISIRLGGYDLDRALRRAYSLCCGKIRHPFFLPDLPPLLPFHLHSTLSTRSECLCRIAELNTVIFTMVKFRKKKKKKLSS